MIEFIQQRIKYAGMLKLADTLDLCSITTVFLFNGGSYVKKCGMAVF